MPRQQTIAVSSVAASNPIPLDTYQTPFNVSFAVTIGAGVLTYTVQHTLDDIWNPLITPVWFDHSSVAAETTNQDGNYAFPIAAIRLNVTAWTSGTATLTVIQGVQ